MITGLEIASIVIACVNAGLGAAKLITDWKARRAERQKEAKNSVLEEALRADALSISSAYTYHYEQLPRKDDRRKFELGDDMSREEMHPRGERFKTAMRDLMDKLRRSKRDAKVVPGIDGFKTSSNSMHVAVIESLARLHQRIVYSSNVPRSLNPLRLFGFGGKKNKAEEGKQESSEGAKKLAKGLKAPVLVKTIEPSVASSSAVSSSPSTIMLLPSISPLLSPPLPPTQSATSRLQAASRSAVNPAWRWDVEPGSGGVRQVFSTNDIAGSSSSSSRQDLSSQEKAQPSRQSQPLLVQIRPKAKADDGPASNGSKATKKPKVVDGNSKSKTLPAAAAASKSNLAAPKSVAGGKSKLGDHSESAKSKAKTKTVSAASQKAKTKSSKTAKSVKLRGKTAPKSIVKSTAQS